jgi:hypothetical protein
MFQMAVHKCNKIDILSLVIFINIDEMDIKEHFSLFFKDEIFIGLRLEKKKGILLLSSALNSTKIC